MENNKMKNWKIFMYFLLLIGITLLFSGLYFSVKSVDTTIKITKERVDTNTILINTNKALLKQSEKNDSIHWVEITKRTNEHWNKIDSSNIEIIKLIKNKK